MATMTLSHKICLDPTFKQADYFRRACGVARFTWNWALSEWHNQYKLGLNPSGLSLKKRFNALKLEEYPWTYEVTKYASQQPFIFLQSAFNRFFKKQSRYPTFKKKGIHDSFYIGNDHIKVEGKRIHIPRLGWVRMREHKPENFIDFLLQARKKIFSYCVFRQKWQVTYYFYMLLAIFALRPCR